MSRAGLARWGPISAIMLVALAFRAWAFTGPSFAWASDESRFLAVVQNMANGHFPEGPSEWFGTRLVLLAPVAGLFRVFGSGDVQAAVWPAIGSLLSVLAAYLLGRDLASRRIGLVAAALVAVAPLEVRLGTVLRPDAIVPGLVGMSVWCAWRARTSDRVAWWALGAGVALGAAWSARENAVVLAPIVVAAGWPVVRRAILPGIAGFAAMPALGALVFAIGAGNPQVALFGAGTEGVFRNPVDAWSLDAAYVTMLWRGATDRRDMLFLTLFVVAAAAVVLFVRRERRAWLPGVWLAWTAVYLEFGTLMNLAKPNRYLTLCTIPAALLVAMAVDHRWAPAAAVAAALTAMWVLWTLPARDLRRDDVFLFARVSDRLASLPPAPIVTESYTWWAKLQTYLATERLRIPKVEDPTFVSPERARELRLMRPLPDPADGRGGYVVTGPVHERVGWPRNWDAYRARYRAVVPPTSELTLVADLGDAAIWRWEAP